MSLDTHIEVDRSPGQVCVSCRHTSPPLPEYVDIPAGTTSTHCICFRLISLQYYSIDFSGDFTKYSSLLDNYAICAMCNMCVAMSSSDVWSCSGDSSDSCDRWVCPLSAVRCPHTAATLTIITISVQLPPPPHSKVALCHVITECFVNRFKPNAV